MLVSKLLDVAWDQWNHHNRIKHGTSHPWKQEEIEILNNQIQEAYSLGTDALSPADQQFFCPPLAATLKLDKLVKLRWLESVDNAHICTTSLAAPPPSFLDPALNASRRIMQQWLGLPPTD
jgi:hypothetical protein